MKSLIPILATALMLVLFVAAVGFVIHRSDSAFFPLRNKHLEEPRALTDESD